MGRTIGYVIAPDAPWPELPPLDLAELDRARAADAERLAALLDSVAELPPLPDPPERGVARSEVVTEGNAGIRTRRAERELRTATRRRQAVELRRSGLSFREIGAHLGISGEAARKVYWSAVRGEYSAAAEEARELELLRCDAMVRRWWPVMEGDDCHAADKATRNLLAAMRLQADLLGLIPAKVDVAVADPLTVPDEATVWQHLQEYRRLDAEQARQVPDVTPTPEAPR